MARDPALGNTPPGDACPDGLTRESHDALALLWAYPHSIREAIAADGGKGAPRGLIVDPRGYSSLWS